MASSRCLSSATSIVSGSSFVGCRSARPGPQPLRSVLRVIVKALAVLAAVAAALLHHLFEQRLLPRIDRLGAEIGFGRLQDFPGEIDGDLVVERQRSDRHAGHAADILDHRRRHAFGQHQMAFADIGADHARGIEAARIVDHDRRLADGAHVIERRRERRVAGLLAENDLDQHHAVDRREEMDADEARADP